MIQTILGLGSMGVSLFQARGQMDAALANATSEAERQSIIMGRAAFSGELERFQISNAARQSEQFRRRQLAGAVGAQRASMAAAGVVGGRTQQLLRAKSQVAFTREQATAASQERLQLAASRYRQSAAIEDARMATQQAFSGAQQQTRQAGTTFFGNLFQTAFSLLS